jgi:hypothetical protein
VTRYTADSHTYVLFALIFGALTLLMLVAVWRTGSWGGAAIPGALLVASMYWLNRFEIVLSGQAIAYRSLFSRRVVSWSDVRRSEVQVGIGSYSDRFKPMFRLVVHTHGQRADRPLVINLKPFRREDIRTLLNMPELKLDRRDDVA